MSAFSFFDKDGSGYITIDELQQACKEFGLSELHLEEMIKEIDQDNASPFSLCFIYFSPLPKIIHNNIAPHCSKSVAPFAYKAC